MKSASPSLAAHLAGDVTTLATFWRITRLDGTEFFFTDHDRDILFEGNVYKASTGYSRTAIANDSSLGVDNLDLEGVFDSAAVTEEELPAGLFDQAEVRIFLVNWADPSMGSLRMRRGWFGEVVLSEQGIDFSHGAARHDPGALPAHQRALQPRMPRRSRRSSLQGADPAAGDREGHRL